MNDAMPGSTWRWRRPTLAAAAGGIVGALTGGVLLEGWWGLVPPPFDAPVGKAAPLAWPALVIFGAAAGVVLGEVARPGAVNRPWWKRKRWAAAALSAALAYPLSFAPACWMLMRADPLAYPLAWRTVRVAYWPAAAALKASPAAAQERIESVINAGRPNALIGGIEVEADRIIVSVVRETPAELGLTIRTHSYSTGYRVW